VEFPEIPDTVTPFGYAEVTNGDSGTSLDVRDEQLEPSRNITIATPVDVVVLPPRSAHVVSSEAQ
jgi:hypothetical protein